MKTNVVKQQTYTSVELRGKLLSSLSVDQQA